MDEASSRQHVAGIPVASHATGVAGTAAQHEDGLHDDQGAVLAEGERHDEVRDSLCGVGVEDDGSLQKLTIYHVVGIGRTSSLSGTPYCVYSWNAVNAMHSLLPRQAKKQLQTVHARVDAASLLDEVALSDGIVSL